jgi:hypothetical protein
MRRAARAVRAGGRQCVRARHLRGVLPRGALKARGGLGVRGVLPN